MFIDEARIYVRSGKGGDGAVHFHREKYVNRGGPDGGDGGHGANVVLRVVPTLNTLSQFTFKKKFIGEDGKRGGVSNMTGKSMADLVIDIPPGTIVYNDTTGEVMGDMVYAGQTLLVCKGGRGGLGNQHFATSRNQAPRIGEKGVPGEEMNLRLELKLIADIGIVGMPNAGKSSFLAAVTNAQPKIGNYPFTTLEPNLGVANLNLDTTLVLADIPGLIEGAHTGLGLGDTFLRHIQRTRVLIHVLNGLNEDPLADFTQINSELALFDPKLAHKPQIIAFNKLDEPEAAERWAEVKPALEKTGYQVFGISALTRTNLEPLLWKALEILKATPIPVEEEDIPVYKPEEDRNIFTIEHTEEGWQVTGKAIERAAAMTYWEHEASVRRFQRILQALGIEDALRKAGVAEGDTVMIGEYELEWQD